MSLKPHCIIIFFLLFQIANFQNSTISSVNNTIIEDFFGYFKIYYNSTNEDSTFINSRGFNKLISDLKLRKRNNKTTHFKNITVQCYSSEEMLNWFGSKDLSKDNFMKVCPALLIQMASKTCNRRPRLKGLTEKPVSKNNLQIWLYSFGAVIVISLVGLIVVWLIPMMPKSFYNSISQLLIALAVGSLAGDALLHLIPHALMDDGKGGHSHNQHNKIVWKSLVALIGIHIFFITERITILRQNLQSKRKSKIRQISQENFYSEVSAAGDKLDDSEKIPVKTSENKALSAGKLHWASKSRKYSGSSRELVHASSHMGINGESSHGFCNRPKSKPHVNSDCPDSMNFELCNTINPFSMNRESGGGTANSSDLKQTNGEIKSSNTLPTYEECNAHLLNLEQQTALNNNQQKENSNWSNNEEHKLLPPNGPVDGNLNNTEVKVLVSKPTDIDEKVEIGAGGATVKSSLAHPFKNKPHGHHHGHSHDLSSVKAIAYTVIAGDGLHNFCDGIAIGAAFANDIRGGFSTAIAVLCHELPHELGDFVVLLHAGMSLRTAIFYNLMSSIFCALGMILGVLLGQLPSLSSWVFMLTAGMFLYIALVDMMPELSTRRLTGRKFFHRPSILFIWQNIGLLIGSAIMLLIALYEEHMF